MAPLLRLFRFLRGSVGELAVSFILLLASTGLWTGSTPADRICHRQRHQNRQRPGDSLGRSRHHPYGLLVAALNLASGYMLIKSSQSMGYEMRNALYRKVMSFSFENLDRWRTGELMVRLNSDVNTVRMFVRMGMFMIVQSIIMIIGTVIAMYLTDPRLAGIMAIFMPLTLVLFFRCCPVIRPYS